MKPNCETCKYRESIPGDWHLRCTNGNTHVKGHAHGIKMGWFNYPWNFDPAWLLECDGYEKRKEKQGGSHRSEL